MLYITDYKTDGSDDLVISNGDIVVESDGFASAIKVGERRCSARVDDFILDDCAAGIEQYLHHDIDVASYNIKADIDRILTADGLFDLNDFEVIIPRTNTSTLQPFIKINSNATDSEGFRVIVDKSNQQSYR